MIINKTEIIQRPFGYACMRGMLLVIEGAVFWRTGRDKRSPHAYIIQSQSQDHKRKRISEVYAQTLASFRFCEGSDGLLRLWHGYDIDGCMDGYWVWPK